MPRGLYDRPYIASGFNNRSGLQPLYKLGVNPTCNLPYFIEYKGDDSLVEIKFKLNEGTQRTGSRRQVPIGLPNAQWILQAVTQDDYQFFADTFCTNRLDGEVTIHTENIEEDEWQTFNAIVNLNTQDRESAFNGFEWRPLIIQFTDMRQI